LYDVEDDTNILVSASADGTGPGNGASQEPLFSPDGRWLVFLSTAGNLVTNGSGGSVQHAYARDLTDGTTRRITPLTMPRSSASWGRAPFSRDGRFLTLAFGTNVVCFNTTTWTGDAPFIGGRNPALDGTGRHLVFERLPSFGATPQNDIGIVELSFGTQWVLSLGTQQTNAQGRCREPLITPNGRYVVFQSTAPNLAPNDGNDVADLFVRDLIRSETILLSENFLGTGSGYGVTGNAVLGDDGRTLLFETFAPDLGQDTKGGPNHIFLVRLGSEDADHDELDDDWELTFFGDLSADGSGDSDGDGLSDRAEFLAGTDPTGEASYLVATAVRALEEAQVWVMWTSVPGHTYRVEFKDTVEAATWSVLGAPITASGTTCMFPDASSASGRGRIYRVAVVVP
jgi:hypothetical protein